MSHIKCLYRPHLILFAIDRGLYLRSILFKYAPTLGAIRTSVVPLLIDSFEMLKYYISLGFLSVQSC